MMQYKQPWWCLCVVILVVRGEVNNDFIWNAHLSLGIPANLSLSLFSIGCLQCLMLLTIMDFTLWVACNIDIIM